MFEKQGRFTRGCSIFLSGAVLLSSLSLADYAHASASAPQTPELLERLALPADLGMVTDTNLTTASSSTRPLVVMIQDLHLHYPTQKRIVKILDQLYSKNIVSGPLGIEGAEGLFDTSKIASYPAGPIKEELVDYFMKKGELSGDEAYSVLKGDGHLLYGIDNAHYYGLNRDLFKATLATREELETQLDRVQAGLDLLKRQHSSYALRRLYKEESYSLASAEALLQKKLAAAKDPLTKNIVTADHMLSLLHKLVRQQVTLDEARYVAQRLPAFVSLTKDLLKTDTEETIKSAVDFYIVALMRNQPMAEHTLALLKQSKAPAPAMAIVAGGFHTAGLVREFKKAGVNYIVITPTVKESPDAAYHELYEKRLLGERLTWDEVAADYHLSPDKSSGLEASATDAEEDMVAVTSSLFEPGNNLYGKLDDNIRTANGGREIGTLTRLGLSLHGGLSGITRSLEMSDPNVNVTQVLSESVDRYRKSGRTSTARGKTQFYLVDTQGHPEPAHAYRKRNLFSSRIVLDQAEILRLTAVIQHTTGVQKKCAETLLDLYVHHELSHSSRFTGTQLKRAGGQVSLAGIAFGILITGATLFGITVPWFLFAGAIAMMAGGFLFIPWASKRRISDEKEERNIVYQDASIVKFIVKYPLLDSEIFRLVREYPNELKGVGSYYSALRSTLPEANVSPTYLEVIDIVARAVASLEGGIRTMPSAPSRRIVVTADLVWNPKSFDVMEQALGQVLEPNDGVVFVGEATTAMGHLSALLHRKVVFLAARSYEPQDGDIVLVKEKGTISLGDLAQKGDFKSPPRFVSASDATDPKKIANLITAQEVTVPADPGVIADVIKLLRNELPGFEHPYKGAFTDIADMVEALYNQDWLNAAADMLNGTLSNPQAYFENADAQTSFVPLVTRLLYALAMADKQAAVEVPIAAPTVTVHVQISKSLIEMLPEDIQQQFAGATSHFVMAQSGAINDVLDALKVREDLRDRLLFRLKDHITDRYAVVEGKEKLDITLMRGASGPVRTAADLIEVIDRGQLEPVKNAIQGLTEEQIIAMGAEEIHIGEAQPGDYLIFAQKFLNKTAAHAGRFIRQLYSDDRDLLAQYSVGGTRVQVVLSNYNVFRLPKSVTSNLEASASKDINPAAGAADEKTYSAAQYDEAIQAMDPGFRAAVVDLWNQPDIQALRPEIRVWAGGLRASVVVHLSDHPDDIAHFSMAREGDGYWAMAGRGGLNLDPYFGNASGLSSHLLDRLNSHFRSMDWRKFAVAAPAVPFLIIDWDFVYANGRLLPGVKGFIEAALSQGHVVRYIGRRQDNLDFMNEANSAGIYIGSVYTRLKAGDSKAEKYFFPLVRDHPELRDRKVAVLTGDSDLYAGAVETGFIGLPLSGLDRANPVVSETVRSGWLAILRTGKSTSLEGLATGKSTTAWVAAKLPWVPAWLVHVLAATFGITHRNELGMFFKVFDSARIRREHPDHPGLALAAFWVMRVVTVAGFVAPLFQQSGSAAHVGLAMLAGAVLSYLGTHLTINLVYLVLTLIIRETEQAALHFKNQQLVRQEANALAAPGGPLTNAEISLGATENQPTTPGLKLLEGFRNMFNKMNRSDRNEAGNRLREASEELEKTGA